MPISEHSDVGMPVGRPSQNSVFLLLASAVILAAYRASTLGFAVDDFLIAANARDASWLQVFTLQAGPFLIRVVLWKLGSLLQPDQPYLLILALSFVMHLAGTALVWSLARERWNERLATSLALCFLFSIGVSEAWTWASAAGDVQLGLGALAAFFCWERRSRGRKWMLAASAWVVFANLAKTSALFFPLVLWLESRRHSRSQGAAVPRNEYLVLVPLQIVCALLAVQAYVNPGLLAPAPPASFVEGGFYLQGLSNLGEALVRAFTMYQFSNYLPTWLLGGVGLFFGVWAVLQQRNDMVRIGMAWAILVLCIPTFSTGKVQTRYAYGALPGLLLVLGAALQLVEARFPTLRSRAPALLGVFAALNLMHFGYWAYRPWYCLGLHDAARAQIRAHAGEVRMAPQLRTMVQLHTFRTSDVLRYDLGVYKPVAKVDDCEGSGPGPCLGAEWPVTWYTECPARGTEDSFLFWKSAP